MKKSDRSPAVRAALAPAAHSQPPLGLRERKKRATRLAISDVATRLFVEQGFDRITLADVARAADVSVNTVLNYFPAKEDLFFDRASEVEESMAEIVTRRGPGEPVLDAIERGVLAALARAALIFPERSLAFVRTIEASSALKARERRMYERAEERLAETLRAELGSSARDLTPEIFAAAVMGVLVRLTMQTRAQLLSHGATPASRRQAKANLLRAMAMLREGLGSRRSRSSP